MAALNKVFLIGNLTRDPELRYTPGGTAVADLGMAVNREFTARDGERKSETCFIDIVVWQKVAESCKEYLHKGSPVFVEGRLQLDTWQTSQGEKRSKMRVVAERVQFLDSAPKSRPEPATEAVDAQSPEPDQTPASSGPEDNMPF